jgi:hypothetical protein
MALQLRVEPGEGGWIKRRHFGKRWMVAPDSSALTPPGAPEKGERRRVAPAIQPFLLGSVKTVSGR